jgi:hypothetical protein
MSDPRRLIDEPTSEAGQGQGASLARDLLVAGRGEALTPNEKRAIWTGLAAHALVSATPAAASVAPTAIVDIGGKAVGLGALAKGTLVVVALAGGVVGGAHVLRRAAPASETVSPASPTAPVAPAAPEPLPAVVRPSRSPALPARESPPAPRSSPGSRLAEEGRVVLDARRALREGDAASALRRLEAARAAFAGGALVQEREALAIEALARLGRRDAAAARARAFLRAYPGSPHAAAVAKLATP